MSMKTLVKSTARYKTGDNPYKLFQSAIKSNFDTTKYFSYDELVSKAQQLKSGRTSNGPDQVLFVDKNIKDFNVNELRSLVRLDAKYHGIKFRLTSNNTTLKESSINPEFRRLLNNGMNYGIYMNSPSQTISFLRSTKMKLRKQLTQVTLSLTDNAGRVKAIEIKPPIQSFKLPITLNDTDYTLSTPSLPILSRLHAVGVPSNHPDLESLIDISYVNPITEAPVPVIKIDPTDSTDLIAIVPKHILEHQKYSEVTQAALEFTFPYKNKFLSYLEMNSVVCEKFGISEPLFTSVPYIFRDCLFDNKGTKLTKLVNNKRVFEETGFDRITSSDPVSINLRSKLKETSKRTPDITHSNIIKIISHNDKFTQRGIEITPDILRSVLIENDNVTSDLFSERYNALDLLTSCLGVFREEYYNFDEVLHISDFNELVTQEAFQHAINESDFYLINEFSKLHTGDSKIGDFIIAFANYLNYNKFYKHLNDPSKFPPERNQLINLLVSNILINLLKDDLKFHFPEFSYFYYYSNVFKFDQIPLTYNKEHPSGTKINEWKNYIQYRIPTPTNTQEQTKFEQLPGLISSISSIFDFPEPFKFHVSINTADAYILENLEFLNQITNSLPAIDSNIILTSHEARDQEDLLENGAMIFRHPSIHQSSTTDIFPIRLIDTNNIKPWVKHYHSIQPRVEKLDGITTEEEFIKHFKSRLNRDIYDSYEVTAGDFETQRLLNFVRVFSDKVLKKVGLSKFKEMYLQVISEESEGIGEAENLKKSFDKDETEFDKELSENIAEHGLKTV